MPKSADPRAFTSRRAVLTGLAVAAVPVGATAAPTGDHELVALGERLDALLPEMTAQQLASFAAVDAADEEAWRRAGLSGSDGEGAPLTEEEHARLWDMLKVVRADLGTENAIRTCEEVWARGDAIHRAIIAGRAQSLQGVAVKARAAAVLVLAQLWDRPASDLDWDDEVIRKLVESISDAAAMPLPYEAIEAAPRGVPVDPIFAVIAEHRAAQEALDAAGHLPDAGDQPAWDRADRRAIDAELPLFTTEPTTIAGVAALLEYVGSDAHPTLGSDGDEVPTVLSYSHGWANNPDVVELARTFARRMGETLRSLIRTA